MAEADYQSHNSLELISKILEADAENEHSHIDEQMRRVIKSIASGIHEIAMRLASSALWPLPRLSCHSGIAPMVDLKDMAAKDHPAWDQIEGAAKIGSRSPSNIRPGEHEIELSKAISLKRIADALESTIDISYGQPAIRMRKS